MSKIVNEEVVKVCETIAKLTARQWRGVITYDEALSECFFWVANNEHKIAEWKESTPTYWRNALAVSLKRDIGRLGQKEVEYYSKNNGAIQEQLEILETDTDYIKDENSYLQTHSYYNDETKLGNLLSFIKQDAANVDEASWVEKVPYIDYEEAQSVVTELQAIYYSLTKAQQNFISQTYVDGLSDKEIAEIDSIKERNVLQKRKRVIKLIQLKLQQYNMVW